MVLDKAAPTDSYPDRRGAPQNSPIALRKVKNNPT